MPNANAKNSVWDTLYLVLPLEVPFTSHQVEIAICNQTPLAVPVGLKTFTQGLIHTLNPNLHSDFQLPDQAIEPFMDRTVAHQTSRLIKK